MPGGAVVVTDKYTIGLPILVLVFQPPEVQFDVGLPDQIGGIETCQPGDPVLWTPVSGLGCGNFGQLMADLDDIDEDVDNHSPQWIFIDDGVIVPGTGGSPCNNMILAAVWRMS